MTTPTEIIITEAHGAGYPESDVAAGIEFYRRKNRLSHPPGNFDKAGRFIAAERTDRVENVRTPSRTWPLSEMKAARTAEHCAELHSARPILVKRIARAIEEVEAAPMESGHERMSALATVRKILKKAPKR